jgi:hypothetical protein
VARDAGRRQGAPFRRIYGVVIRKKCAAYTPLHFPRFDKHASTPGLWDSGVDEVSNTIGERVVRRSRGPAKR